MPRVSDNRLANGNDFMNQATDKWNESIQQNELLRDALAGLTSQQAYSGFATIQNIGAYIPGGKYPNYLFTTGGALGAFDVALINGYKITLSGGKSPGNDAQQAISLPEPPTTGTREDFVFLEAWFYLKNPGDNIYKDGNVNSTVERTATSYEKVLEWRIRTVAGVEFIRYPEGFHTLAYDAGPNAYSSVTPQGSNTAPLVRDVSSTAGSMRTSFTPSLLRKPSESYAPQVAFGDTGLYVAGQGDSTSKSALGTFDGYVYAIPLFRVKRRNSGSYRADNINGARNFFYSTGGYQMQGIITPGTVFPLVVSATDFANMQIGDIIAYTGNTGIKHKVVAKDAATSTVTFQSVGISNDSGSFNANYYLQSDRTDGLYSNIIDGVDVIDLRHQVSIGTLNYQQLLETSFDSLIRGNLQTKDRMKTVKERFGLSPAPVNMPLQLLPVTVKLPDGTTKDLVNLLGNEGDFEKISWSTVNATATLDSANAKYGSSAVKLVAAGTTASSQYYKNFPSFVAGKYYLYMSDLKAITGNVYLTSTANGAGAGTSPAVVDTTKFNTAYLKLAPTVSGMYEINHRLSNNTSGAAYIDGTRLYEIDKATYDLIDVDPNWTGDNLTSKFPYVSSFPSVIENFAPPFTSPDWVKTNTVSVSDNEFVFNPSGSAKLRFKAPTGTKFYFWYDCNFQYYSGASKYNYVWIRELDASGTQVRNNDLSGKPSGIYSLTTGTSTDTVEILLSTTGGTAGDGYKFWNVCLWFNDQNTPVYNLMPNATRYIPYGRWVLPYDFGNLDTPQRLVDYMNSNQRQVWSDAQMTDTVGVVVDPVNKNPQKHVAVTQATPGVWAANDTIVINSYDGVIGGVPDTDTALAKVTAISADGLTLTLDDVSKLATGDTFVMTDFNTIYASQRTISSIDATNKTITISSAMTGTLSAYVGCLLIETTTSSSVPTTTATGLVGTWTGLGTKSATFTINTAPTTNTDLIKIQYSVSYPAGKGITQVPYDVLEGKVNGERLVKDSSGILHVKANFVGKVSGSTDLNPHISKVVYANSLTTTPLTAGAETGNYTPLSVLDGSVYNPTSTTNGNISQSVFTFNVIRALMDKLGSSVFDDCATLADKVAKAKTIITRIDANWWGNGTGPAASTKASFAFWLASTYNTWDTPAVSTQTGVTKVNINANTAASVGNRIDSNGNIYLIAYADASDGVTSSVINTDYVEIELQVSLTEAGYDVFVPENQFPSLVVPGKNILSAKESTFSDLTSGISIGNYLNRTPVSLVTAPVSGKFGIKFSGDPNGTEDTAWTVTSVTYPAKAGDFYTLSWYQQNTQDLSSMSTVSGAGTNTCIIFYDSSMNELRRDKCSNMGGINTNWHRQTFTSQTAPASTAFVRMAIGVDTPNMGTPDFAALADFKLELGVVATPWSVGGKKSSVVNLLGKVAGSVFDNPSKAYGFGKATFDAPSVNATSISEHAQQDYDQVAKQDGTVRPASVSTAGQYIQQMFEFDLSQLGLSFAELKSAIRKFTVNFTGNGVGDSAGVQTKGVTMKFWRRSTGAWVFEKENTGDIATISAYESTNAADYITSDQKVYVLIHSTYPASANYASSISTDYVSVTVDLADYVDYVKANAIKVRKDTKEIKLAYPKKSYRDGAEDVVELFYRSIPYQGQGNLGISGKILAIGEGVSSSHGTGGRDNFPSYNSYNIPGLTQLPLVNPDYSYSAKLGAGVLMRNKTDDKFENYQYDGQRYWGKPALGTFGLFSVNSFATVNRGVNRNITYYDSSMRAIGFSTAYNNSAYFLPILVLDQNNELYLLVLSTERQYGFWGSVIHDTFKLSGRPLVKGV
jgi:hypothetical protein